MDMGQCKRGCLVGEGVWVGNGWLIKGVNE